MIFWIDAQLDPSLAPWMGNRFKILVKHLVDVGLADAADETLYDAARRFREVVIISKDSDFTRLSHRLGPPPQVLHLRCGNLSTLWLQALLDRTFPDALNQLQQGEAIVEIAGP